MQKRDKKNRTEYLKTLYKKLKEYDNQNNYKAMCATLFIICRYALQNRDYVFQCLYKLTQNGYYKDVEKMLINLKLVLKDEEIYLHVLNNSIKDQEYFANLNDEEKSIYATVIEQGHIYYEKYEYEKAYEMYSFGLEKTKQPIFFYYLGKIFFKLNDMQKAEECFLRYVQVGDTKMVQAYLYLSSIAYKTKKMKTTKKYYGIIERLNKLSLTEFDLIETYTEEDFAFNNFDRRKARVERNHFRNMELGNGLDEDYGWLDLEEEGKLKK